MPISRGISPASRKTSSLPQTEAKGIQKGIIQAAILRPGGNSATGKITQADHRTKKGADALSRTGEVQGTANAEAMAAAGILTGTADMVSGTSEKGPNGAVTAPGGRHREDRTEKQAKADGSSEKETEEDHSETAEREEVSGQEDLQATGTSAEREKAALPQVKAGDRETRRKRLREDCRTMQRQA